MFASLVPSAVIVLSLLAVADANHGAVLELSQSTFDQVARDRDSPLLVEFYAPWCVHCRNFESSYSKVAVTLGDTPTRVGRVDASANRVLLHRFNVKALPSFFYIHRGKIVSFRGHLSVDALSEFATSQGAKHGESYSPALGPFHPYWRVINWFFISAEKAHTWILADTQNMLIAAIAAFAAGIAILILFTAFIHLLTKPPPPRLHAE